MLFCTLERRFFFKEHRETHFPDLFCLQQNIEKFATFDQNHGLTPLKNPNFSTFLLPVFIVKTGVFSF